MITFRAAALFCLCALVTSAVGAIEEPAFDVVATVDGIEYRQYQPYLVAETLVAADESRSEAASVGFRRLFKYISGENQSRAKIEMTAPVRQKQEGTKIAMTAPVRQGKTDSGWSVAFVLPASFTLDDAPQPTNPAISILEIPGELVAVLGYSGRWSANNVSAHRAILLEKLADADVEEVGDVAVAYYNSPFSLPFMRRNEVMVPVSALPAENSSQR